MERIACTHCGTPNGVASEHLGEPILCHACDQTFVARADETDAHFDLASDRLAAAQTCRVNCDHCGAANGVAAEHLGREIVCYKCEGSFIALAAPVTKLVTTSAARARKAPPPLPGKRSTEAPALLITRDGRSARKRRTATGRLAGDARGLAKNRWAWAVLLAVIFLSAAAAWGITSQTRHNDQQRRLDELWARADGAFRILKFSQSRLDYRAIDEWVEQNGGPAVFPQDAALSSAMQQLVEGCIEANLALANSGEADPRPGPLPKGEGDKTAPMLTALAKFDAADKALRGWEKKFPDYSVANPSSDEPIRFEYAARRRYDDAIDWLHDRIEQLTVDWSADSSRGAGLAMPAEAALEFVGRHREVDRRTTRLVELAMRHVRRAVDLATFERLSQAAEKDPRPEALVAARDHWAKLGTAHEQSADPSLWASHAKRLRASLKSRLAAETAAPGDALPGEVDATPPPRLPLAAEASPAGEALVFARCDDRCFALSATSGEPRWVCRLGKEMEMLPRSFTLAMPGDEFIEVTAMEWMSPSGPALTIARTADLSSAWTWRPEGKSGFAGPPIRTPRGLCVLLGSGELWELAPEGDRFVPMRKLALPEPPAGALTPRDDELGAIVVGESLAAYAIGFENGLSLADVMLFEETAGESSHGLWVPPIALIAKNGADEKCRLTVYRDAGEGLEAVQSLVFAGRLRRPPAVSGALFLAAADRQAESIWAYNSSGARPLETVFQPKPAADSPKQAARRPTGERARFAAERDGRFLLAGNGRIICYTVDQVKQRFLRERQIAWSYAFPDADSICVQELQMSGDRVVVVTRAAAPVVTVHCLDAASGELAWSRKIDEISVAMVASSGKGR